MIKSIYMLVSTLALLATLGTAQSVPTTCNCTLVGNGFTGMRGNSLTSSLTETVACTAPRGAGTCSIAGTITWTPGVCGPCCPAPGLWADGTDSTTSSYAQFRNCIG